MDTCWFPHAVMYYIQFLRRLSFLCFLLLECNGSLTRYRRHYSTITVPHATYSMSMFHLTFCASYTPNRIQIQPVKSSSIYMYCFYSQHKQTVISSPSSLKVSENCNCESTIQGRGFNSQVNLCAQLSPGYYINSLSSCHVVIPLSPWQLGLLSL